MKHNEYKCKLENKDFIIIDQQAYKGSRTKKLVEINKQKAFLKYPAEGYNTTELCSEKICYELANVIGFKCAKIDFAKDDNEKDCILNYLFINNEGDNIETHTDIKDFLNKNGSYISLKEYYYVTNIFNNLYTFGNTSSKRKKIIQDFINIMVFDALVGESDRHDENWGITKIKGNNYISPLYDNSANLLRELKGNQLKIDKLINDDNEMLKYINKGKTLIYSDAQKKITHFELIDILLNKYPNETAIAIMSLGQLTDNKIDEIVDRIPKSMMENNHKEAIKKYIKKRRNILLSKVGG